MCYLVVLVWQVAWFNSDCYLYCFMLFGWVGYCVACFAVCCGYMVLSFGFCCRQFRWCVLVIACWFGCSLDLLFGAGMWFSVLQLELRFCFCMCFYVGGLFAIVFVYLGFVVLWFVVGCFGCGSFNYLLCYTLRFEFVDVAVLLVCCGLLVIVVMLIVLLGCRVFVCFCLSV